MGGNPNKADSILSLQVRLTMPFPVLQSVSISEESFAIGDTSIWYRIVMEDAEGILYICMSIACRYSQVAGCGCRCAHRVNELQGQSKS